MLFKFPQIEVNSIQKGKEEMKKDIYCSNLGGSKVYINIGLLYLMEKITSFFGGLTGGIQIQIKLDLKQNQKYHKIRDGKQKVKLPVFNEKDDISGTVSVNLKDTKKYQHLGIKCYLIGFLQIFSNKDLSTQFTSLSKQLEPAGIMTENKSYKFKFPNVQKEYQTFNGISGRVRYFIRVIVAKNYKFSTTKEEDFAVLLPNESVEKEMEVIPMKMEVGIEECLHIDFQYNKSFYHLRDVIMGRVNFHLVKIKLKSMQIALVRKQTFGTGTTTKTETETLIKYEVMDGCPDKGEFIPIRMYMKGIPLAPSYKNIHNRLSVKYWINLVLLDQEDRRYFKQTQVTIYRKP